MYSLLSSCGKEVCGAGLQVLWLQCGKNYHFVSTWEQRMEGLAVIEVAIVKAIMTTSGESNTYYTRGFKNPINKAKSSCYTEPWHRAMVYWQHRTSLHNGWTQPACWGRQQEAPPAKSQREVLKWLTKLYDLQVLSYTISLATNLLRRWESLEPRLAIMPLVLSLERSQEGGHNVVWTPQVAPNLSLKSEWKGKLRKGLKPHLYNHI